jgi:hypothetical protein
MTVAISSSSRKQMSFRRLFKGFGSSRMLQMYWSPYRRRVATSSAGWNSRRTPVYQHVWDLTSSAVSSSSNLGSQRDRS